MSRRYIENFFHLIRRLYRCYRYRYYNLTQKETLEFKEVFFKKETCEYYARP